MIVKAMVGETCTYCKKSFGLGQNVNLVGKVVSCPPGTGCTGRVLESRGVQNLSSTNTGPLTLQFQRPLNQ